jgi:peptidoglycan/xylan/chitin deacetylase (PgdA/CDA1 family)
LAAKLIKSDLFRPPYGALRLRQAKDLRMSGYSVIMWTVLSRDFDKNLNLNEARIKLRNKLQPGAIVVFHDSAKAINNLAVLLPEFIEYCLEAGYTFKSL